MPTDRRRWLRYLCRGTHIGHTNSVSYRGFMREVMPPPPWLPTSQCLPKGEKTCQDSRPTRMQNFTPLAFSATEKSVTVQTNKQWQTHSKLTYPFILPHGGGNMCLIAEVNEAFWLRHKTWTHSYRTNSFPRVNHEHTKVKNNDWFDGLYTQQADIRLITCWLDCAVLGRAVSPVSCVSQMNQCLRVALSTVVLPLVNHV